MPNSLCRLTQSTLQKFSSLKATIHPLPTHQALSLSLPSPSVPPKRAPAIYNFTHHTTPPSLNRSLTTFVHHGPYSRHLTPPITCSVYFVCIMTAFHLCILLVRRRVPHRWTMHWFACLSLTSVKLSGHFQADSKHPNSRRRIT